MIKIYGDSAGRGYKEKGTGKSFGEALKKYRTNAGLTQNELAQLIDISPSHISKIEQGNRNPLRMNNIKRVVNALGLGEKESQELFAVAGYSFNYETLVSQSHYGGDNKLGGMGRSEIPGAKNPAVRAVIETLTDPELPIPTRKEIEKTIAYFAEFLRTQKKEEIYKSLTKK